MRRKENNFYWKLEGKRQVATNFSALRSPGAPRAAVAHNNIRRPPHSRSRQVTVKA